MLKKFTLLLLSLFITSLIISFSSPFYSSVPPSNHTGAPGQSTCMNCHGSASGGGSVTVSGLPTNYIPGQTYNFSVTINHPVADRQKWGFQLTAKNANNNGIGSFTTGPNTTLTDGNHEISHSGAVTTSPAGSYTYSGMSWTAPSTPGAGDNNVTFYVVGNAANGDFSSGGDFIYQNSLAAILPIELKEFRYKIINDQKVHLTWQTASESNSKEFIVERSYDNNSYIAIGYVAAAGYSSSIKKYDHIDNQPGAFNRPVYYRLKLVDNDGKFKYSKTVQTNLKAKSIYMYDISPNPVGSAFALKVQADKKTNATVSITNTQGALIQKMDLILEAGINTKNITVSELTHGRYFIKLQTDSYTQSTGFIKL